MWFSVLSSWLYWHACSQILQLSPWFGIVCVRTEINGRACSHSLCWEVGVMFLRGKLKDGKEHGENFGGKYWRVYTPLFREGCAVVGSCILTHYRYTVCEVCVNRYFHLIENNRLPQLAVLWITLGSEHTKESSTVTFSSTSVRILCLFSDTLIMW
jgi:hypothetical protein